MYPSVKSEFVGMGTEQVRRALRKLAWFSPFFCTDHRMKSSGHRIERAYSLA